MDKDNICYTGIGSVKSGNHTRKKYLEVMNKNFKKECTTYTKNKKCKSCRKSKEMSIKIMIKALQAELRNKTYKTSQKTQDKRNKLADKCKRCENNKPKKCTLKNYIEFSGANYGNCEPFIIDS